MSDFVVCKNRVSTDQIPKDRPVIMFITDEESRGFYPAGCHCHVTREDTQKAIEETKDFKYNRVVFTSDLSSAEYNLLDNFIIGVARAGWKNLSIETVYIWIDEEGMRCRTSEVKPLESNYLLESIKEGTIF